MRFSVAALTFFLCLFCLGCRKKQESPPPPPPAEPDLPATVSFTDTNEVVGAKAIEIVDKSKAVTADFNLDGLDDLVVIEETQGGKEQVSIYIRKPASVIPIPKAPEEASVEGTKPVFEVDLVSFYKAGVIMPLSTGRIIGLMTRRGCDKQTDILLVVAQPNGRNDIVHYRNEGSQFVKAD